MHEAQETFCSLFDVVQQTSDTIISGLNLIVGLNSEAFWSGLVRLDS